MNPTTITRSLVCDIAKPSSSHNRGPSTAFEFEAVLAATGEFDNMCAMGLATDQKVETDCSVNATYEGKTYCFGNEAAKEKFMENPEENLAKAKEHYEEEVEG